MNIDPCDDSILVDDARSGVMLPVELWPVSPTTGWGSFAIGLALGLARLGRTVVLPPSDLTGLPATIRPTLEAMMAPRDEREERVAIRPYGLHWPKFLDVPHRTQVVIFMAEDTAIPDHAIAELKRYPLVLAPSRWAQNILTARGVDSTLFWQGYNESVFHPAPRARPIDGPLYVFTGGKLEFRKAHDCVIEAFRRFRGTPEGKDAVLVTSIDNIWPSTMAGVYESGYVKGIPVTRDGKQDIPAWLEANGIPRSASLNLGMLSQSDMAVAIRECDFAIFPNRCECATNLIAPEVAACGIPTIIGNWTGQADVVGEGIGTPLHERSPVTLRCPIYSGYDGWGEPDIDAIVNFMGNIALLGPYGRREIGIRDAGRALESFGWSGRAQAMHDVLMQELDA